MATSRISVLFGRCAIVLGEIGVRMQVRLVGIDVMVELIRASSTLGFEFGAAFIAIVLRVRVEPSVSIVVAAVGLRGVGLGIKMAILGSIRIGSLGFRSSLEFTGIILLILLLNTLMNPCSWSRRGYV